MKKSAKSESVSSMTGRQYTEGFQKGFLAHNINRVIILTERTGEKRYYPNGEESGDIDLVCQVTEACMLFSLFPTGKCKVQTNDIIIEAGTMLFFELTSARGELFDKSTDKGNSLLSGGSKLQSKVSFYENYVPECRADNAIVIFVYNGVDPATVKQSYEKICPKFKGFVIHFPREEVASWEAEVNFEALLATQNLIQEQLRVERAARLAAENLVQELRVEREARLAAENLVQDLQARLEALELKGQPK